jgi:hypothetical protein
VKKKWFIFIGNESWMSSDKLGIKKGATLSAVKKENAKSVTLFPAVLRSYLGRGAHDGLDRPKSLAHQKGATLSDEEILVQKKACTWGE